MRAGPAAPPPRSILLAGLGVAALLAIPYAVVRLAAPPPGSAYLPVAWAPHDWLVYVALVEQPWADAGAFLSNPFTTEPQSGRFVLVLLQVLNTLHHVTGLSGGALLELARPPLLLLFVLALWSFVSRVLASDRDRRWAALLVLLSGGWEFVLMALADALPRGVGDVVRENLWHLYGWSTFAAAYNPLWLAGLSLLLAFLARALAPEGPGRREAAVAAGVLVLLWFTHPYSAVAAAGILAGAWAARRLLGEPAPARRRGPMRAALGAAALVIGVVTLWQRGDPVFRASTGAFVGTHDVSIFWYPLTFGVLLVFAIRGLARWVREAHPWRFAIGGGLGGAALLASSDLLNGYHFVPYLHVLLCVAAAPAVADAFERAREAPRGRLVRAALAVALFASTAANTALSVRATRDARVPASLAAALERLGALPPGNVLAPAWVGNAIPAYGPHRVYVGHYFMTPDHEARRLAVEVILADPQGHAADLRRIVETQRIDYCLVPAPRAGAIAASLGPANAGGTAVGDWAVLLVRRGGETAGAPP